MGKKSVFKKDKYKQSCGGYSRLLSLRCRKCETEVAQYQKDGPGNLRRMYMDRIHGPEALTGLQREEIKDVKKLSCPSCGFVVGIPYVYEKEKRNAFRIFQDALTKKIIKTT